MRTLKILKQIEELNNRISEKELNELQRRELLLKKLEISRLNNSKLFSINPKGENYC